MTAQPAITTSDHSYMSLSPLERQLIAKRLKNQYKRLNSLYWIVDADGNKIPFRMNRTQKLLYLALHYLNIVLKSRQHGITTFACILFLDICLFIPHIHAAIIAHNREDAEEFFQNKVKFAYDNLPDWLKALVRANRSSSKALRFSNGSSIRVTTSGRSGTYQLLHVSELGKISARYPEKAREIVTGSLNTVHPGNWVIIESTAEGKSGAFYEICQRARKQMVAGQPLTKMDYKFHFFPWYLNPLNRLDEDVVILDYQKQYFEQLRLKHAIKLTREQINWYVKKWNEQGEDMKREHPSTPDEAFEAALRGTYYTSAFTRLRRLGRITKVPHQPGILVDTWWDIGLGDTTAIWFTQTVGREIHVINYYENSDEGLEFYKREVLDHFAQRYGYIYGIHGAPHDIMQREWGNNAKTRLDSAKELGINFEIAPRLRVETGIEAVRKILNVCWFDEVNCTKIYNGQQVGLPSLESYRKEWDEKVQAYKNRPLHDWASHGADAFRTLATLHTFDRDNYANFYGIGVGDVITAQQGPSPEAWT